MMIPILQNPDRTNLLLDFAEYHLNDNWDYDPKVIHSIRVQDQYFKDNIEACLDTLLKANFTQRQKIELDLFSPEYQEGLPPTVYRLHICEDTLYIYSQQTPAHILTHTSKAALDKAIDNYLRLWNLLTNMGFTEVEVDHNVFTAKFQARAKLQQPEACFKKDLVKWHSLTRTTGHSINFRVDHHNSLPQSMYIIDAKALYMKDHLVVSRLENVLRDLLQTYKNTINMPN